MTRGRQTIKVRLHGEPVLALPGGRRVALEPRAAALLALVAFEPGLTRLRAATLLWPDAPDARRNLRQQLLRFRRLAQHDLVIGQDTLALAEDVAIESADLPLLGSLALDGCHELEAWLECQRRSALDVRLQSERRRLQAAESAGDYDGALEAAQRLLLIDALDESHHRDCMRLHYLTGNGAAGLAAFERLERMLAVEFGSCPSVASLQLAEALRTAQGNALSLATLVAPHQVLPVTLRRPPVLAGRADELAKVSQAHAEGRVAWIEGEAGMGKSRLVGELLEWWRGEGVFAGSGRPGDGGAPYATLARMLRPALAEDLAVVSAAARRALQRVVSSGGGDSGTVQALRPGELVDAVSELLGARRVSVLLLDDLQFADEATIELFAALAAPAEASMRWVVTARPAELTAAGRTMRRSLAQLQRLAAIGLPPLDAQGVAALVDALAIQGLQGSALALPLLRHTGGNPLFVLETIKQGLQDGSLARGQLPRPVNVGTLIEARLACLSEPALALARVAAIAGVDFGIELAEATIGTRAVHLASAWRELQDAQILREEAFAHDLVSDAVLRGVPQVVARRVSAQCAAWLAEHGGEPARVARHWLAGGEPAKAGHAFIAAARHAEHTARIQEETALFTQAAQAFAMAGLADERFEALCQRVRTLSDVDFSDEAVREARALVGEAASDAQRMRAELELIRLLVERGQEAEAAEIGRQLMAMARRHDNPEMLTRAAIYVSAACCRLGRAHDGLSLLLPLREWVESQADEAVRMLWHGEWAAALANLGRLREAVQAYGIARAAAQRLAMPDAEARLTLNCAVALRQSGQFEQALQMAREGHALSAHDSKDATHVAIARLVIARDECETGRYDSALAALEDVLPRFESAGASFWAQAARMVLASLWLQLGQTARAMPLLADDAPDVPAWLRADRLLLRLDLAQALQQRPPADALQISLQLAQRDAQRGAWLQVRGLRHLPAPQVLAEAAALADALASTERFGVRMALQVHRARAALAEGRIAEAVGAVDDLMLRFDEGYAPDGVYCAEAWWIASRVLAAAERDGDAAAALARGARWVRQHALPHVPPPFIDSFLRRNPVNRELLAAVR